MLIECPWCGLRDEEEFSFGGPSHVTRPESSANDAAWADYLFNRDNPAGISTERWCHRFGCELWFNVARHTVTHEILAVYAMGKDRPGLETPAGTARGRGRSRGGGREMP